MPFTLPQPRLKIVETVLQSLTRSDWFENSDANVKACTQLVMVLSGNNELSIDELHAKCIDTARELFGKRAFRS